MRCVSHSWWLPRRVAMVPNRRTQGAVKAKPRARFYKRAQDDLVLERIRAVTKKRATYGHRRVGARVRWLFGVRYNSEEDPQGDAHAQP